MSSDSSQKQSYELSVDRVGEYLMSRGVFDSDGDVEVHELGGGVSNEVWMARQSDLRVVVKQALGRLRVTEEWLANKGRTITEGEALRLADRLIPHSVPPVIDLDLESCAVTIAAAPASWENWKVRLLRGNVDPVLATHLGTWLGTWQVQTVENAEVARHFASSQVFEELRIEPFYETVAQRRPELRASIERLLEGLRATRRCLVHGDYSPKNILVGDAFWVIDFEVAHLGDPAFDVAFMLSHLFVKKVHSPSSSHALERCIKEFWFAYRRVAAPLLTSIEYVMGHVGCLMVARVDGKSPVEYLSSKGRDDVRAIGSELLLNPPATIEEALSVGNRAPGADGCG